MISVRRSILTVGSPVAIPMEVGAKSAILKFARIAVVIWIRSRNTEMTVLSSGFVRSAALKMGGSCVLARRLDSVAVWPSSA